MDYSDVEFREEIEQRLIRKAHIGKTFIGRHSKKYSDDVSDIDYTSYNDFLKQVGLEKQELSYCDFKEYIILPPISYYNRNTRLKKFDKEKNCYVEIPYEKMTEYEKELVRYSDIRNFKQSFLIEDINKRVEQKESLEELRQKLKISIIPMSLVDIDKSRIYRLINNQLKKIPLPFMAAEEVSYVCKHDRELYSTDKPFLKKYFQALSDYQKCKEKYKDDSVFYEYENKFAGIKEIWRFDRDTCDILVEYIYTKPKYFENKKVKREIKKNGSAIFREFVDK
jgi:hypothetical protein